MNRLSPIILEPIMDAEITTPNGQAGDMVDDLNHRRFSNYVTANA